MRARKQSTLAEAPAPPRAMRQNRSRWCGIGAVTGSDPPVVTCGHKCGSGSGSCARASRRRFGACVLERRSRSRTTASPWRSSLRSRRTGWVVSSRPATLRQQEPCASRCGGSLSQVSYARAKRSRTIALRAEPRLLYADSSALVKLVIEEPESAALERHLAGGPVLATSRIALVEVPRATALANPAVAARRETERLLGSCMLIDVTDTLLRAASRLTSRAVRTLDAIHLASALRVQADEVVAYDGRLIVAAGECGFTVSHPGAPA
jgi:uncharacterized protein